MIQVVNWLEFQHYKGRSPPWIKLHRRLLEKREWHALSGDASKLLAECWLLAAESDDGTIPMDAAALAWRLRRADVAAVVVLLQELVRLGFIECDEASASKPLATCKQDATPEVETETEGEGDKTNSGGRLNVENSPPEHTLGSVALEADEVLGMGTWGGELGRKFNDTKSLIRRQWIAGGVTLESIHRAIHGLRVMVDNEEIDWLKDRRGKPLDGLAVLLKSAVVQGPDGSQMRPLFQLAQEAYARPAPTRRATSTGPVNIAQLLKQGSNT